MNLKLRQEIICGFNDTKKRLLGYGGDYVHNPRPQPPNNQCELK